MIKLLCFLSFLLFLAMSSNAAEGNNSKENKMWCVAKVSAPDNKMQGFLDYACSKLDCSAVKAGGQCYEPNTLRNHASYSLDLFYRVYGECDSQIGTLAVTDPSFGGCHYP